MGFPGIAINTLYMLGALVAYVAVADKSAILSWILFLIILSLISLFVHSVLYDDNKTMSHQDDKDKKEMLPVIFPLSS